MIVQLNLSEEECAFSSWGTSKMYTPGTTANSQTQRVPTKINKNDAVAKVYKNFSGTRDTIRHLKILMKCQFYLSYVDTILVV